MSIIQIIIQGTELENVTVNLDTEQVTALYLNQQRNQKEVTDFVKKLTDSERMTKHNSEGKDRLGSELQQAHGLERGLRLRRCPNGGLLAQPKSKSHCRTI